MDDDRIDYPGHPPFLSAAADRTGLRHAYNDALRQPALGQVSSLAAQAADQLPRLRPETMARARTLADGLALAHAAALAIIAHVDPDPETGPPPRPRRAR